jgi:DNA repair exonuclease SbcCD ATPase subunit
VPFGPIQQTVAWYALHAHVGDTHFFIARQPPSGDHESNDAMLVIGDIATPSLHELDHNTSRSSSKRRRELRRLNQRLRAAEAVRSAGLDRAGALLAESVDVGLLADRPDVSDLASARRELRRVLDNPTAMAQAVESGGEFDRLRDRRRHLSDQVRDLGEQIRALEQFADADHSHSTELTEQHARLASIGLISAEGSDAICALCGRALEQAPEARTSIERALGRAERRLELARETRPASTRPDAHWSTSSAPHATRSATSIRD